MTKKHNKTKSLIKSLGTIVMLVTIGGVLFAFAGQLGVFGDDETPVAQANTPSPQADGASDSDNLSPMKQTTATEATAPTPKYNFINELQGRTTELAKNGQTSLERTIAQSKARNAAEKAEQAKEKDEPKGDKRESYRYVVQIGGFSRKEDAEIIKARAEALGYPVQIVSPRKKFLVQAGPLEGISNARAAEKYLRKNNFDTLVKRITDE